MRRNLATYLFLFFLTVILAVSLFFSKTSSLSSPVPEEKKAAVVSSADSAESVSAAIENSNQTAPVPVEAPAPSAVSSVAANPNELVIADFNSGDKPNNIKGDFGIWNKDPEDRTQGCSMTFDDDDVSKNSAGHSLRLDYDVDSDNPAYNGFWMKLNGFDASAYNTVSIAVRGEGYKNFTKRIKFEMKDSSGTPSPYIVNGITDRWQRFDIPFERFRKIHDWSALSEFVVVFDDINSDPKQGTILIDDILFKK